MTFNSSLPRLGLRLRVSSVLLKNSSEQSVAFSSFVRASVAARASGGARDIGDVAVARGGGNEPMKPLPPRTLNTRDRQYLSHQSKGAGGKAIGGARQTEAPGHVAPDIQRNPEAAPADDHEGVVRRDPAFAVPASLNVPSEVQDQLQILRERGKTLVQLDAEAKRLEEMKKPYLMKLQKAFQDNGFAKSIAQAEMLALASADYDQYITDMVSARKQAELVKVEYEAMGRHLDFLRTYESTDRMERNVGMPPRPRPS